ncbi:MAG: amidohydrolase [Pontibacterium sp.]
MLDRTLLAALALSASAQSADMVLTNGKILTVDKDFSRAQALAVDNGRIVAIGSNEEVQEHITPSTQVTNLAGKTVIPGLIDNHMHLVRASKNWAQQVRLEGVTSYQEALERIAQAAQRAPKGQWLFASGGFVERQFEGRPRAGFLREDLDKVAPNNPLYMQHLFDWGYANSAALKQIDIDPSSPPNMAGLLLNNQGLPLGPVTKRAQWLLEQEAAKQISIAHIEQTRAALDDLARAGLTTVVDAGGFDTTDALYKPFTQLAEEKALPIRVFYMKQVIPWGSDSRTPDLSRLDKVPFNQGHDFFRPVAVGEQLMLPVQDSAANPAQSSPQVREAFLTYAQNLAKRGIPLHLHAVNDQSINQHLDAFEIINQTTPLAPLRWTLAHVDGIEPATIDRAQSLGINFAIHSRPVLIGYRFQSSFGNAAKQMTPMKTLTDKGALWGLGSDSPVVSIYNPFRTLWWAVNGQMVDGTQVSEQVVDRKQALIAHTINNAKLSFMEDELGSLEVGKRADLLVLDQDYLAVPSQRIAQIKPIGTLVEGRWAYKQGDF